MIVLVGALLLVAGLGLITRNLHRRAATELSRTGCSCAPRMPASSPYSVPVTWSRPALIV